ncbi:hypothetical protein PybrP1_004704 [[Pythium] brassicae (nom. inval.)]|nr:hypothetical protein PybrP1_004704 [[Pythium] brassicae (nom. inval.)]
MNCVIFTCDGYIFRNKHTVLLLRKWTRHSNKLKLAAVDFFEAVSDMQKTVAQFFPSLSSSARFTMGKSIYLWRKQRAVLVQRCATTSAAQMRYNRGPFVSTTLSEETKQEVVAWVNMLRSKGAPVSNTMLREKAKAVAVAADVAQLEASWSWCKAFRARHKLSIRARTRHGQIAPAAATESESIPQRGWLMMERLNITTVHNPDQTGVCICERTKWSPASRTANGNQDNKVQRHGFGPHIWKVVRAIQEQEGVQIFGNAAWWTADLTIEILRHQFAGRAHREVPVLLLLDELLAIGQRKFPHSQPRSTFKFSRSRRDSRLCVNQLTLLKSRLRELQATDLAEQLRGCEHDVAALKLQVADRAKIVRWVCKSWGICRLSASVAAFAGRISDRNQSRPFPASSWML